MEKTENLGPANLSQVQTDKPEKYIYLAIMTFWITGALILGYVVTYSGVPINADILPALLASYLIGISLIVFQSYFCNIGFSLLFSILVLCVPLAIGVSWMLPLMALGFTVVAWLRQRDIGDSIGRVGPVEIATLIVASCAFAYITLTSRHDADFFLLWDIIRKPTNGDPIFHSAITAMIKNYGVISVGLDGLITLNYHIFSHILRAAISFGTGLPVINTYGVMQLLVSEPLLILTIVAMAETIRPSVNARSFFIRIVVLFIAFYSINIWPMFGKYALWPSYATSDSYAISLILMMATICSMRMERGNFRLPTLVALTFLCTASKVSTGTICVAIVVTYLALFDRNVRISRIMAGIAVLVGWGTLLYMLAPAAVNMPEANRLLSTSNTSTILLYGLIITAAAAFVSSIILLLWHQKSLRKYAVLACALCTVFFIVYLVFHPQLLAVSEIQRFYFLRIYAGLPNDSGKSEFWAVLGNFALVHFFFTWLLAMLAANFYFWDKDKARYLGAPLLFSLAALSISWLVLFFTSFAGGAEYYFSNVAMFIALPYLLTVLSERINGRVLTQRIVANVVPLVVLTGALLGVFTLSYEKGLVNFISAAQDEVRSQREPSNQKFAQMIAYLEEIRRDPTTKNLGVYIAKEEKDFWDVEKGYSCSLRPLIIPAVSERSGLLALPDPLKCNSVVGYGYDGYQHDAFEMSALPRVTHKVLLKRAVEAGLDGYVDVRRSGWTVYRN